MSPVTISCVVEGHGERVAVPLLVRRIAFEIDPALAVRVPTPIRIGKGRLLATSELERAVDRAARRVESPGGVLIVMDADDDCPATMAPKLVDRARRARGDVEVGIVLANREFEAWFLAGAESLRGQRGLLPNLEAPPEPERIRGAKEWLRSRMESGRVYSVTLDQPALTHALDLHRTRKASPSFDKCWREIARLLERPLDS